MVRLPIQFVGFLQSCQRALEKVGNELTDGTAFSTFFASQPKMASIAANTVTTNRLDMKILCVFGFLIKA
jgi:hypothetical protein